MVNEMTYWVALLGVMVTGAVISIFVLAGLGRVDAMPTGAVISIEAEVLLLPKI